MSPDQTVNSDLRGTGILMSVKAGHQTKDKPYDPQILRLRLTGLMHDGRVGRPGETAEARVAYLSAEILKEAQGGGESPVVETVANVLAEQMDTHRSEYQAWPPIIPNEPIVGV